MLRRVFEPKRGKLTGGFRILHSEDLHNMFSSAGVIRVMIGGRCSTHAGY